MTGGSGLNPEAPAVSPCRAQGTSHSKLVVRGTSPQAIKSQKHPECGITSAPPGPAIVMLLGAPGVSWGFRGAQSSLPLGCTLSPSLAPEGASWLLLRQKGISLRRLLKHVPEDLPELLKVLTASFDQDSWRFEFGLGLGTAPLCDVEAEAQAGWFSGSFGGCSGCH